MRNAPLHRRDFLKVAASAPLALSSLGMLGRIEAQQIQTKIPIVVFFASGGAASKETFSPDPIESPENLRGPFRSIQTRTGERFSELFPMLAERGDRLSLIRSLDAESADHIDAARRAFIQPGSSRNLQERIGESTGGIPHAFLNPGRTWPAVTEVFHQQSAFSPVYRNGRFLPPDLAPDPRLGERRQLLNALESPTIDSPAAMRLQRFRELAYELLSGGGALARAFDLPENERDRYGRSLAGDGLLLAKRLIQSGAGSAVLYHETDGVGWDFHSGIEEGMRRQALETDRAVSAIIDEIHRGTLHAVFLLATEFSRSPAINRLGGRDHHAQGSIAILAGGHVRPGVTYGRVNNQGEIRDGRVPHSEFGNTVLLATGSDIPPQFPRIREILT